MVFVLLFDLLYDWCTLLYMLLYMSIYEKAITLNGDIYTLGLGLYMTLYDTNIEVYIYSTYMYN